MDLGRGLGLMTMGLLDEIDDLYLVTTAEVPALHLTRKIMEVLSASNYSEKKIHLVANRSDKVTGRFGEGVGIAAGLSAVCDSAERILEAIPIVFKNAGY